MIFGAPAATVMRLERALFLASLVEFFARGCGEKMMPLRVLREMSDLNIAVDAGPGGWHDTAGDDTHRPCCDSFIVPQVVVLLLRMPRVFSSLYLL